MHKKGYKIITVRDAEAELLKRYAEPIKSTELKLAREIAVKLKETLKNMDSPAAGLAAPQIGINKALFVYTADRILENLITVINPIILSASTEEVEGWEACFSAKFSTGESIAAYLPRHREITVQYMDIEGDVKENKLTRFAAKVFQHEFDHLQGIVNINHKKIIANRDFTNQDDFEKFMQIVRENDAKSYLP